VKKLIFVVIFLLACYQANAISYHSLRLKTHYGENINNSDILSEIPIIDCVEVSADSLAHWCSDNEREQLRDGVCKKVKYSYFEAYVGEGLSGLFEYNVVVHEQVSIVYKKGKFFKVTLIWFTKEFTLEGVMIVSWLFMIISFILGGLLGFKMTRLDNKESAHLDS